MKGRGGELLYLHLSSPLHPSGLRKFKLVQSEDQYDRAAFFSQYHLFEAELGIPLKRFEHDAVRPS